MNDIKLNNNYSKVCGIAYDFIDIKRIIKFCKKHLFEYYYIKHLPDIDDLKVHYHFIIFSDRKRFIVNSLLSDTFKINLFQQLTNLGAYLRYMTHFDYPLKKQYSVDKIKSNMPIEYIEHLINNSIIDKKEKLRNDFNLICSLIFNKDLLDLRDIIIFCNDNNIEYNIKWTYTFNLLLKNK